MTQDEIEKLWFSVFEPVPGVGLNISRGVVVFAKLVEAATLEKAAKVCEPLNGFVYKKDVRNAMLICAAAIRSVK